jgi:hypothetical protein
MLYKVTKGLTALTTEMDCSPLCGCDLPTAVAQAFLIDYPEGERAITHHAGPVRIGRLQMQPGPTAYRAFRSTKEREIINFWSPIQ